MTSLPGTHRVQEFLLTQGAMDLPMTFLALGLLHIKSKMAAVYTEEKDLGHVWLCYIRITPKSCLIPVALLHQDSFFNILFF